MTTTQAWIQPLSRAQFTFEIDAVPQVQRLIDIHRAIGGSGRGRRRNLEVLNKSAIVLTCAFWEAFIEDLAAEALRHLAEEAASPKRLPIELRKTVAKASTRKGSSELAPWDLAGDGWRHILHQAADRLSHEEDQTLSSPSARKVEEFFRQETGIAGLANSWKWNGTGPVRAQERLDDLVKLRNAIAHRGAPALTSVTKGDATAGLNLVKRIAACSLTYVNDELGSLVGKKLLPDPIPVELPVS